MILTQSIEIPANTSPSNPIYELVFPTARYLQDVWALFPSGCLGLVGIRILDRGTQIIPQNGWMFGNNQEFHFGVGRNLTGPPFQIRIEGHSLASDWVHTIRVRMEITQ